MDKYTCSVCGYEYNPAEGDGESVAAGTDFAKVPADWCCPVCGVGKGEFNKS